MAETELKKVQLHVLTPTRTVLEETVDYVLLRTSEGDMGVLPGHAPCSVMLDYGVVRGFTGKQESSILAILGGFATVENNRVTVLSNLAEPPDQIDAVMAQIAADRAANQLEEQSANLEMSRAELALRRALVRMDISSYPVLKGQDSGGPGR